MSPFAPGGFPPPDPCYSKCKPLSPGRGGRFRPLERHHLERLKLAARYDRRHRLGRDRFGQTGQAFDQRARGEHASAVHPAGVEDAGGRVHRVADEGDLLLRRADLAQDDDPGVQRGAEVRVHAEAELIERPARPEPVARVEAGAHDSGLVPARPQAPRGDDLVAHVLVDLAAVLLDRRRDVDDESVEDFEEARLSEPFPRGRRATQVDEQERPFLGARTVIAAGGEGEQDSGPEQVGHPPDQVSNHGNPKGESEVAEPYVGHRAWTVEERDDERHDRADQDHIGRDPHGKIDEKRQPSQTRARKDEDFDRGEHRAANRADRHPSPWRAMRGVAAREADCRARSGERRNDGKLGLFHGGSRHTKTLATPGVNRNHPRRYAATSAVDARGRDGSAIR